MFAVQGVSYATSGHFLVLGDVNSSNHVTVIERRGDGPALALRTADDEQPLRVTSTVKVKRLNADAVDGLHAADLQTQAITVPIRSTDRYGPSVVARADVPPGTYLTSVHLRPYTEEPAELECWMSWLDGSVDDDSVGMYVPAADRWLNYNHVSTTVVTPLVDHGQDVASIQVGCRVTGVDSHRTTVDWGPGGRFTLVPLSRHTITSEP